MEFGPYVILEGPDGTGKTTLANEIIRRTGASYIHCGPPDKPALGFYLDKLRSVKGPAVVDRLHVGSYCYGIAFRYAPDLTEFENWLIEGFLYAHGAQLVYCDTPAAVVDQNLARGPDNADAAIYEAPEKRALVRALYEERMFETELPLVRYDYTSYAGAFEDIAAGIVRGMLLDREEHRPLPEMDAIGNTVSPRHILVADRPSWYDKTEKVLVKRGLLPTWRLEFMKRFSRRYGGLVLNSSSGRYMYMAIQSAQLRLREFAMLNSIQGDGRHLVHLALPWQFWNNADTVALGRNAAAELVRVPGAAHRTVPHPQHVRRFHYKDVMRYAAALRDPTKPWECGTSYCKGGEW
jgi:hypothetical protein